MRFYLPTYLPTYIHTYIHGIPNARGTYLYICSPLGGRRAALRGPAAADKRDGRAAERGEPFVGMAVVYAHVYTDIHIEI